MKLLAFALAVIVLTSVIFANFFFGNRPISTQSPPINVQQNFNYEVLKKDIYKQTPSPDRKAVTNQVINSQKELEEIWNTLHENEESKPELPNVNFNKETATLVVHSKINGDSVVIKDIKEGGTGVEISVLEQDPGKGCPIIDASFYMYPYQLIKIERVDKEIKFSTTSQSLDCE